MPGVSEWISRTQFLWNKWVNRQPGVKPCWSNRRGQTQYVLQMRWWGTKQSEPLRLFCGTHSSSITVPVGQPGGKTNKHQVRWKKMHIFTCLLFIPGVCDKEFGSSPGDWQSVSWSTTGRGGLSFPVTVLSEYWQTLLVYSIERTTRYACSCHTLQNSHFN